jgi:hypothetical protein
VRHTAPDWWHLIIGVVSSVAGIGIAIAARRLPAMRPVIAVAVAMIALQVAAIVAYHFGVLQIGGGQGRYLFPMLGAIYCLIWLGWREALRPWAAPASAALSLLAIIGALNMAAWVLVLLPVYV